MGGLFGFEWDPLVGSFPTEDALSSCDFRSSWTVARRSSRTVARTFWAVWSAVILSVRIILVIIIILEFHICLVPCRRCVHRHILLLCVLQVVVISMGRINSLAFRTNQSPFSIEACCTTGSSARSGGDIELHASSADTGGHCCFDIAWSHNGLPGGLTGPTGDGCSPCREGGGLAPIWTVIHICWRECERVLAELEEAIKSRVAWQGLEERRCPVYKVNL